MNKIVNWGVALVAVAALAISLVGRSTTPPASNGTFSGQTQVREGSLASPDIMSPYLRVGGVSTWYQRRESLIQASTTYCSLTSPAASSTLRWASMRVDLASSTAVTFFDVFKGAYSGVATSTGTQFGTTFAIAAGAQATIVASSTTGSEAGQAAVFAPNTVINFKRNDLAGETTATASAPSGTCEAFWTIL